MADGKHRIKVYRNNVTGHWRVSLRIEGRRPRLIDYKDTWEEAAEIAFRIANEVEDLKGLQRWMVLNLKWVRR